MNNLAHVAFLEYAKQRGIIENSLNEELKLNKSMREESALDYLKLISEFHKKIMGYNDYICYRLQDKRGRILEQYKIFFKKATRELQSIRNKEELNSFEKVSLEYGETYLKISQKCIEEISNNGYLELIKRSMNRCEIVLGDNNINNIRKGEFIEVACLKECAYDLVELDAVYYLNKLIKKGIKLDYEKLLVKFCEFEYLSHYSLSFMKAMITFPHEFIRCFIKGTSKQTEYDVNNYLNKLKKSIEISNINLL
ncbi:hypothetical protein CLHOM_33040 [Clostridium homopropionicum DSM 5847]|uniref:Spore coat protein n=1 Tax=Clostridium homopropionicum DSM 5847 TaxID=1121318 RepID=A0A0L6Z608_9CLOT|nr:hypothetical protein [Clostridium homopropionicum]KOA18402.1 hypothetical protein CLHOM_33040 [Clostridium homopropionicum DSM 5847]SFF67537.1 hypothetical protein SAMN04488501_101176 [Clostridium homopropionicum]